MEPENAKEERLKLQIRALRSGNRTAIMGALTELRSEGNVSILPDLFDLLLDQEDQEIRGAIISLLNDLKEKDAVPVLSEAIGNPEYSEILTILVSACWQNGLSYAEYIDTFMEVLLTGNYETAIEAFTVIEDAAGDLSQEHRDRFVTVLKSRLGEVEELKKPLLSELAKVMTRY